MVIVVGVACFMAASATAASGTGVGAVSGQVPVLEWDVASSWWWDGDAGTWFIDNTGSLNAGPLKGGVGSTSNWNNLYSGKPVDPELFGLPEYVAGGAGAGDRPYVDMNKYSYIGVESQRYEFGNPVFSPAVGYTEIGFFYFASDMAVLENTGIGAAHDTNNQNLFLYADKGLTITFKSWTEMVDGRVSNPTNDNRWCHEDVVNVYIPRDAWVQLAKVFDVAASEVRYYINDELVFTSPFDFDLTHYVFEGRGDVIGHFGTDGRCLTGMSLSYFAAYNTVLSLDEITESYAYLTGIPEPATMTLLALGGLALLRRRGR